ncbi:hypothetical protein BCR39DRAFT_561830 [Naematelia encephala]|uniref:Uncharacterized protein n=1 Tax=Naematelia encephala TaxID=71784 RepID=A0A1Y2AMZ9_9TREE|nr:hypothetical protein BCR39DRAFT_561830 [Naematelia encephala]
MIPRILPVINFVVATTALTFQVYVLLPWHHELSEHFAALKTEQTRQLAEYHEEKRSMLNELHIRIKELEKRLAPPRTVEPSGTKA